jgi:hypothetical protein
MSLPESALECNVKEEEMMVDACSFHTLSTQEKLSFLYATEMECRFYNIDNKAIFTFMFEMIQTLEEDKQKLLKQNNYLQEQNNYLQEQNKELVCFNNKLKHTIAQEIRSFQMRKLDCDKSLLQLKSVCE